MKTDSIFYRLFQEIPSIFFELIGNSPQVAELYQFSSSNSNFMLIKSKSLADVHGQPHKQYKLLNLLALGRENHQEFLLRSSQKPGIQAPNKL